jgi:hypothetical protein
MEPAGDHVRIRFHEPLDPALRRDGPVDVACHLYDPDALKRAGREAAAERASSAAGGAPPTGLTM